MSISLYQASVPLYLKMLSNLIAFIEKAEAHAAVRKYDPEVLTQARLAPDMLPFIGQIQRASDTAKGTVARLTGQTAPSFADTEVTLAEAKDRLRRTIDYIKSIPAEAFDNAETRQVSLQVPGNEFKFTGLTYLTTFALPNFYFHATAAYAILRHNGVDLGKMDYIGGF